VGASHPDREVVMGIWVGIDVGKEIHFALVLDGAGGELLAREIGNTEEAIERLRRDVRDLGEPVFAVDMTEGPVALLLAVLVGAGEDVRYVNGLSVNRSRLMLAGESKTDRRDALTIAENLRLRGHSLPRFGAGEDTMQTLRLLMRRRADLVADRTRAINRLRDTLLSYFPGLERVLEFTNKGPLLLVGRYNTPDGIRRSGAARIERHLKSAGAVKAHDLAQTALAAAKAQSVRIAGQDTASSIVSELAAEILRLNDRVAETDERVAQAFFSLPQAEIITSMPGFGPRLGAELLVEIGDVSRFASAGHLAAYAGIAPVSRDSGKSTGNRMRARGGNKRLKRVMYHAAFISIRCDERARAFYDRKRAEGKRHHQAIIALARRRTDVLYAMLVHGTHYASEPVAA
jgi:transposase